MLSLLKGWIGEKLATLGIVLFLNRRVYRRIDNLILAADDGSTTQIDHLLVSRFGIFVIETKNMKGWIYGRAEDAQWTQAIFGRKYRFQNPLRQNYRHKCVVAEKLGIPQEAVHGVVFFIGECRFKTPIPEGVFCRGVATHIHNHGYEWFSDEKSNDSSTDSAISNGTLFSQERSLCVCSESDTTRRQCVPNAGVNSSREWQDADGALVKGFSDARNTRHADT